MLCAAGLGGAWAFALWVPSAGLTITGVSVITALLLVLFALFAAIASFHGHGAVVMLLFLASFFPVGVFLLRVDHWLKWAGFADLGLLVAALLMFATRHAAGGAQGQPE